MDQARVNVLFLSEGANNSFHLRRHLEQFGCRCQVANCVEEGLVLVDRESFDLLLSTHRVHLASALIARLEHSVCSAFYRLEVEDGFWWVPILERGRKCLGLPALRAAEFVDAIDRIIAKAQLRNSAEAQNAQAAAA
jgi:hypothetical protein